jgi:DNA-binding transcriptional regulator YiaG
LGFAHRTIRASRNHISANRKPRKAFPTIVKTLGDEIQVKRKESELSARKLAGMLNVPVATVTSWERGQSIPNPAQLALISKLLGGSFRCNPTVQ